MDFRTKLYLWSPSRSCSASCPRTSLWWLLPVRSVRVRYGSAAPNDRCSIELYRNQMYAQKRGNVCDMAVHVARVIIYQLHEISANLIQDCCRAFWDCCRAFCIFFQIKDQESRVERNPLPIRKDGRGLCLVPLSRIVISTGASFAILDTLLSGLTRPSVPSDNSVDTGLRATGRTESPLWNSGFLRIGRYFR